MTWSSRVIGISAVEITRLSCLQVRIHSIDHKRTRLTSEQICSYKFSRASSHAYMVCHMNVRRTRVGSCDFWNMLCQYTLWPGGWIREWKIIINLDAPANRIRSWRNGAVVAGMFNVGWYEIMVLPLIFRMRWTDKRSKTRRRLSTNLCQIKKKIEIEWETDLSIKWEAHAYQYSENPVVWMVLHERYPLIG